MANGSRRNKRQRDRRRCDLTVLEAVSEDSESEGFDRSKRVAPLLTVRHDAWKTRDLRNPAAVTLVLDLDEKLHPTILPATHDLSRRDTAPAVPRVLRRDTMWRLIARVPGEVVPASSSILAPKEGSRVRSASNPHVFLMFSGLARPTFKADQRCNGRSSATNWSGKP